MRRVLTLPVFRRLAVAYGLNELATQIAAVVLVVLVYQKTGSAVGAAVFFLCTQFAPAIFGPSIVTRLDRRPPGTVLPAIYGVEAVLYGLLAALVASGVATAPILLLAFVDGILALAARSLARTASVAVTTPQDLLREGNAFLSGLFSVCYMVGPGVAGLLLLIVPKWAALVVVAGAFALITIVLVFARGLPKLPVGAEDEHWKLRDGLRHFWRQRYLRSFLSLRTVALIIFTISIPVEVVLADKTLHAGGEGYAWLLTSWGAGTVLGSVIFSVGRHARSWMMLSLAALLLGIGFLVMALAPTLAVAAVGAIFAGTGNGVDAVSSRTWLQEAVEPRWMALAMALNESMWTALPGTGVLLGGIIAVLVGARVTFAIAGVGALLLVVVIWLVLRPQEARRAAGNSAAEARTATDRSATEARAATDRPAADPL